MTNWIIQRSLSSPVSEGWALWIISNNKYTDKKIKTQKRELVKVSFRKVVGVLPIQPVLCESFGFYSVWTAGSLEPMLAKCRMSSDKLSYCDWMDWKTLEYLNYTNINFLHFLQPQPAGDNIVGKSGLVCYLDVPADVA